MSKALVGQISLTRSLLSNAQAVFLYSQTSRGLRGVIPRLPGYLEVSKTVSDRYQKFASRTDRIALPTTRDVELKQLELSESRNWKQAPKASVVGEQSVGRIMVS